LRLRRKEQLVREMTSIRIRSFIVCVKKWDTVTGRVVKEVPWGWKYDIGMTAMALTIDDKSLFVGGEYGELMQLDLETMIWTHNYSTDSKIDEDSNILSMFVSEDNEFLFMSNDKGYIKQFNIKDQKLALNWMVVTPGTINKMLLLKDGLFLTSDTTRYGNKEKIGNLKLFSIKEQKLIKDFGSVVESGIVDMVLGEDGMKVYLAGGDKHVYEFCLEEEKLCKDWGQVMDDNIAALVFV